MNSELLRGVHVLDLGTMITAPLAGMMLADFGAEVIKIEHPCGGDPFRNFDGGAYSPNFIAYNHGKRSLKLDLRSVEGADVLKRLVVRSDVLLENYRPDVLTRLGFGTDILRAINPRLIHCSVTGFGATGPYSGRPAFDTVGVALSGVASLVLDPENPHMVGPTIADNVTGMYACYGILGALYERTRTGKGRRIEVNMLEASVAVIPDPIAHFTRLGRCFNPLTRVAASQSFAFRCADDKLLVIHLSIPEKFWQCLLEVIERPKLALDKRFRTRRVRIENYCALKSVIGAVIAGRDRDYWMARLDAHDVPFAPVNSIADVPADPQIVHLGTFCEAEHPVEGRVVSIRSPVWVDGARDDVKPPPTLGENTNSILAELGYSAVEIAALRQASVV